MISLETLQKNKIFIFVIQTVIPFSLPFLFEMPEEYISKEAQIVMVILLAIIDLLLIYLLNENKRNEDVVILRNKYARDAYSNVYELNESKRDYIIERSYRGDYSLPKDAINILEKYAIHLRTLFLK